MEITAFETTHFAQTPVEVGQVLRSVNADGFNCCWLKASDSDYPRLCVLVRSEAASLHFFPSEFDAGSQSVGEADEDCGDEQVTFQISSVGDEVQVQRRTIVPLSLAIRAVIEFAETQRRPASVEWHEL